MSKEEAMNALIESGMELRRDDIELGKKLERNRIVNLLAEHSKCKLDGGHNLQGFCFCEAIALLDEDQK